MAVEPRWILSANYDTKVLYERIIWDEHASGMLSTEDFRPRWLLFVYSVVRHVNGKSGTSNVGIARLAQDLGYESENHGFQKALRVLLDLGFLTRRGNVRRAPKLSLSVPEALRNKTDKDGNPVYATLFDSTTGDLVTVIDTSKPAPIPESVAAPTPDPAVADEQEQDWSQYAPEVDDGLSIPRPIATPPSRRSYGFNAGV
ncbi:hypothetical protein ACFV0L_32345 [Streptosporangium canum]|uniref:hypothetical protein n=1 Tax=Streptosporangium canum TaxID=324952 RepID=UPI0036B3C248